MAQLWGGRFTGEMDSFVNDFNASILFDSRMYAEDIEGSIAHAEMLAAQGILTEAERDAILQGLVAIKLKEEDPLTIGYITRNGSAMSVYGRKYVEEILKYREL